MALSENVAIGNLLPDVKIRKMIINDSNDYFLHKKYSHIPIEAIAVGDDLTGNSSALIYALGIFGSSFKVRIVMSIRDTISHSRKSYLFNSLELEKYLIVRVHQFADFVDTEEPAGLNSVTATQIKMQLNNSSPEEKHFFLHTLVNFEKNNYAGVDYDNNGVDDGVFANGHTISNYMLSDLVKGKRFKTNTVDNRYYDIPFEITMHVPHDKPTNLFYIAYTTLDFQAIKDDFGIEDPGSQHLHTIQGDLKFGVVYENGILKRTATNFYTPSGKLWTGPMHYHEATNRHMAGAEHQNTITLETDPNPHFPLVKSKIRNLKIQDMRTIKKLDIIFPMLQYDFKKNIQSPLRKMFLTQDPAKSPYFDSTKSKIDTNGYVSTPWITHDVAGNPRIYFALDMLQLIRENFLYGNLLSKTPAAGKLSPTRFESEIFKNNPIKEIRITRQKIKNGIIDKREPEKVIATAYQTTDDGYDMQSQMKLGQLRYPDIYGSPDGTQYKSAVKDFVRLIFKGVTEEKEIYRALPTDVGIIKDISQKVNAHASARKQRSFVFTDLNAKAYPGQHFSYKIKLVLKDTTLEAVQRMLEKANSGRREIEKYLELIELPNMYDAQFDQLSEEFLNLYYEESITRVNEIEIAFRKMLQFFKCIEDPEAPTSFSEAMFDQVIPLIHPYSVTPESLTAVLELYNRYLKSIEGMLDLKKIPTSNAIDKATLPTNADSGTSIKQKDIVLSIRLEKDTSNHLTYVAEKNNDALFRQPYRSTLHLDFFGSSGPRPGLNRLSNSSAFSYSHIGMPLFGEPRTNYTGFINAFGSLAHAGEDPSEGEMVLDSLGSLTRIASSDFITLAENERKKYFKSFDMEYGKRKNHSSQDNSAKLFTYTPSDSNDISNQNFYFTPLAMSRFAKDPHAGYPHISGRREHRNHTPSFLFVKDFYMNQNPTVFKYMQLYTAMETIEYFYQKLFPEVVIEYPIAKVPGVLEDVMSHDLGHLFDEAGLAAVNHNIESTISQDMERIKKNIAYLLTKVCMTVGISPSAVFLGETAAYFNDATLEHEYTGGVDGGGDFGSIKDNVEAQFLNEAAHTEFLDAQGDRIYKSTTTIGLDLERIELMIKIVLSYLLDKLTSGPPERLQQFSTNYIISDGSSAMDPAMEETRQETAFKDLPPQIKYLIFRSFLRESDPNDSIVEYTTDTLRASGDSAQNARSYVNDLNIFELIYASFVYKVEYLTFAPNADSPEIETLKDHTWKSLTINDINNNPGTSFLCRLVKYNHRYFTLNFEDHVDIDLLDRYFFVEVPADVTSANSTTQSEDPADVTPTAGVTGDDTGEGGNDDGIESSDVEMVVNSNESNTGGYSGNE